MVVTLTEDGAGTLLRLEHTAPARRDWLNEFGPGAVGIGWEMALMGCGCISPTRRHRPDPDYTDPGYAAFVHASGTAWAETDAAAGTDPEQAGRRRSAASRPTPPFRRAVRCTPSTSSAIRFGAGSWSSWPAASSRPATWSR